MSVSVGVIHSVSVLALQAISAGPMEILTPRSWRVPRAKASSAALGSGLITMGGARALFVLRSCPALVVQATAPVAHRLAQPHPWHSPSGPLPHHKPE